MTKKLVLGAMIVAFLAIGLYTPAADPKTDDDAGKICMALQMADIGRQAGSPEALVAAAKLLNSVEKATAVTCKPVEVKDASKPPKESEATKCESKPADFTPMIKELLDEARKLAKATDDARLLAVIDAVKVNSSKGATGGPKTVTASVDPGGVQEYTFEFAAGQEARVTASSTNGRRLSLEIYRRDGTPVGSFTGKSAEVYWTPKATNTFTIRVTNQSNAKNSYTVVTN